DTVLLVRDRLGIKPLWFCRQDNCIRFSSEIRALVTPGDTKIDKDALSEYIGFGRMPAVGNIYNGIQSLPPGAWIKINSHGVVEQKKWWSSRNFTNIISGKPKEIAPQVKQLVTKAIEEHLISDVGIGSFL